MIPLAMPNLCGNEARYLQECIETAFVSSVGPFVDRFELEVAKAAGAAHAVATSSGTAGLHAALTAVGVGRDDLVALPSWTFIASANAIHQCGATPWLFDVSSDSWTLDATQLEQALETQTERRDGRVYHRATGRRVAAIMPVHTLGVPADMNPISQTAADYDLPVVVDAAAALGATYRGEPIGAVDAALSVFSFNGNKTTTAGGGGAVTGGDAALCAHLRHLTTTARCSTDYQHDLAGFNYRMTNIQAAVGVAQLELLDTFVSAKRRIARRYDMELGGLDGVECFPQPEWAESACWLAGVRLRDGVVAERVGQLHEAGVGARAFWRPMHLQRPYAEAPKQPTPVADSTWQQVLTLPCSTQLSDDDQQRVIDAVRAALARQ
jgi:perosamine synthetase